MTGNETAVSHIIHLCDQFNGRIGFHAHNLQTGAELTYHADDVFPTASAIKLPILVTLMQQIEDGQFSLADPLMLRRADRVEGSGLLKNLTPGLTLSIRDWAYLMMSISDNTATNVLINQVGLEEVANWLAQHRFPHIHLHHKLDLTAVREDQNHFGTASPRALSQLLMAVFRHEVVSPAACEEMMRMMDKVGQDRVGRYLPWEPWETQDFPEGKLHLVGKTGSFVGTRTQTAVVWRGDKQAQRGFALTVMSQGNPEPETWSVDAPGVLVIGQLARFVYDWVFADA